ncbi:hypothetical protein [Hydrogenobaculum acidophilum]
MKIFLVLGLLMGIAFGYVGDSYDEFLKEYKNVKILSVNKSQTPEASRALEIQKEGFTIYALFNNQNICYEEYSIKNKILPPPSFFIKDAKSLKPKLIFRIPLRMAVWEYDTPRYKILYQTFGIPGYLGADARIVK